MLRKAYNIIILTLAVVDTLTGKYNLKLCINLNVFNNMLMLYVFFYFYEYLPCFTKNSYSQIFQNKVTLKLINYAD